jgi:uncharacterized protein
VDNGKSPIVIDWPTFAKIIERVSDRVLADGIPELVVGVLRGGMIPAVIIAHAMDIRTVRAVEITHTTSDSVNAEMSPHPTVANAFSIGDIADLDVLIVDDVVGTTHTISVAKQLVLNAGAARVRTLACCEVRGYKLWDDGRAVDYVGATYHAWVTLPWEK